MANEAFKNINNLKYDARLQLISETIAKIASEILSLPRDQVTNESNLLEIGLDSLLAGELRKKIKQIMGIEIQFKKIFEFPVISQLSKFISDSIKLSQKN